MTIKEQEALRLVREAAAEAAAAGGLPTFFGELERARIEILVASLARAVEGPIPSASQDRLLTVAEVAQRLGRSKWWIYENKNALPIVRLPTGRYGFSERGLDRWIARRVTP